LQGRTEEFKEFKEFQEFKEFKEYEEFKKILGDALAPAGTQFITVEVLPCHSIRFPR